MRLSRFQFKLRTLMIAVAVIAVGLAMFTYLSDFLDNDPMGKGSPVYAEQWKKAFETVPSFEAAKAKYPQVVGKQFDDGSWVFGVELDSHANWTLAIMPLSERVIYPSFRADCADKEPWARFLNKRTPVGDD